MRASQCARTSASPPTATIVPSRPRPRSRTGAPDPASGRARRRWRGQRASAARRRVMTPTTWAESIRRAPLHVRASRRDARLGPAHARGEVVDSTPMVGAGERSGRGAISVARMTSRFLSPRRRLPDRRCSPSPLPPRPRPGCQREGAKLLAAAGSVRVVSVKEKPQNAETRRDRIYGCWTPPAAASRCSRQRDFGLDLIERAHFEIVDGRYIGVDPPVRGRRQRVAAPPPPGTPRSTARSTTPSRATRSPRGDSVGVAGRRLLPRRRDRLHVLAAVRDRRRPGDRELEPTGTR